LTGIKLTAKAIAAGQALTGGANKTGGVGFNAAKENQAMTVHSSVLSTSSSRKNFDVFEGDITF
jgi:hypothetical protein